VVRKVKEILDESLIQAILEEADIFRIAMRDGDETYIVPLNFGYDGHYLYFHSAKSGKKVDLLKENNRICFETDIRTELVKRELICNWGMKYLSVIGKGQVKFITENDEKKKALDIIINKYAKGAAQDFSESSMDKIEVFRVEILEITGKKSGF
jgi:nitroimidazol reductase NimA-like FMN-containing flavoprotein (pyridoxamine 5'-phosphate oxidase superfamily)